MLEVLIFRYQIWQLSISLTLNHLGGKKKRKEKLYFLSLPQYPKEPPDCLVDFPVQFAISWMPQVNCRTMHLLLITEIHMQCIGGNEGLDFVFLTPAFFPVHILLLYMLM